MSPEQISVIFFAIVVPVLVQALKLVVGRLGRPLPTWVVQVIAASLSAVFVYINGGFAGIALPVFAGDPLAFAGSAITLLISAWGVVELTYRLVLKAVMEGIQAKLA